MGYQEPQEMNYPNEFNVTLRIETANVRGVLSSRTNLENFMIYKEIDFMPSNRYKLTMQDESLKFRFIAVSQDLERLKQWV